MNNLELLINCILFVLNSSKNCDLQQQKLHEALTFHKDVSKQNLFSTVLKFEIDFFSFNCSFYPLLRAIILLSSNSGTIFINFNDSRGSDKHVSRLSINLNLPINVELINQTV